MKGFGKDDWGMESWKGGPAKGAWDPWGGPGWDVPQWKGDPGKGCWDVPHWKGDSGKGGWDVPQWKGDSGKGSWDLPQWKGDSGKGSWDVPQWKGDSGKGRWDVPQWKGDAGKGSWDVPQWEGDSGKGCWDVVPYGKGDYGKGWAGKGESDVFPYGKGDYGKGCAREGDSDVFPYGKGDNGKGESAVVPYGKGDYGKGCAGKGESDVFPYGKGDYGKGCAGEGESDVFPYGKGDTGKGWDTPAEKGKENGKGKHADSGKGNGKGKGKGKEPLDPNIEVTEKIFVGGFPFGITLDAIFTHFSTFGNVTDVEMKYDPKTGEPRGFAFVTFDSVNAAAAVLENHENNTIDSKWIDCRPAENKGKGKNRGDTGGPNSGLTGQKRGRDTAPPTNALMRVSGLPANKKERDVFRFFFNYSILRIRDNGGDELFIEFASQDECTRAFNDKQGARMGPGAWVELSGASLEEMSNAAALQDAERMAGGK